MIKRLFLILGIVVAVGVVVIPFVAISSSSGVENGRVAVAERDADAKELFAANCGTCHTLAAAGTDGVVGPDLDERLAPGGSGDYQTNYDRTVQAVVCGFGNGRMPARILTGENAKEVAAFVGAYAGQLGDADGPLVDTSTARRAEPSPCGGTAGADEGGAADEAG